MKIKTYRPEHIAALEQTAPMSRRVLAKLTGAGALWLAAPFRHAHAQQGSKLKRLAIFSAQGGWHAASWFTNVNGRPGYGGAVKALEPFFNKTTVIQGLNNKAGGNKDHHFRGNGTILTAVGPKGRGVGNGRSFDHYMSDQIGRKSAYKTVTLGYRTEKEINGRTRVSYTGSGAVVNPEANPIAAFDRLFKGVDVGNAAPGGTAGKNNGRRSRVLDAVKAQIAMVEKELVGQDKERIQAHLSNVEMLDRQIADNTTPSGCAKPDVESLKNGGQQAANDRNNRLDTSGLDPFLEADLQADVMAASLACGLTDVASLQMAGGGYRGSYAFLPEDKAYGQGAGWHGISHNKPAQTPEGKAWYLAIDRLNTRMVARLLTTLDATPEDGGTMLDHTAVLYVNDLARPYTHSHNGLTWHLFGGGAAKKWQHARYLDGKGAVAQNLFVNVQEAFGIDSGKFGSATGTIPGL